MEEGPSIRPCLAANWRHSEAWMALLGAVIDVRPTSLVARVGRWMLRHPPRAALRSTKVLVGTLWPVHKALWRAAGRIPGAGRAYNLLRRLSPVMDYQRDFPTLSQDSLRDWAVLDTHDTLTDVFKHVRTAEQIAADLEHCGMVDIEIAYGGNGVEARARQPVSPHASTSGAGTDRQGP